MYNRDSVRAYDPSGSHSPLCPVSKIGLRPNVGAYEYRSRHGQVNGTSHCLLGSSEISWSTSETTKATHPVSQVGSWVGPVARMDWKESIPWTACRLGPFLDLPLSIVGKWISQGGDAEV